MDITGSQLVEHVMRRAALRDPEEARQAIFNALTALGERMEDLHAHAISARLPAEFRSALCWRAGCGAPDASLQAAVARRSAIPESMALEQLQVVCEELGHLLDDDARRLLALDFQGGELGWFDARDERANAPPHDRSEGKPSRNTLAEGRPSTGNPLSEARPGR